MKEHNASKDAACRHPVRQRHAALLKKTNKRPWKKAFICHRNLVQRMRPLLLVPRLVPLQDTSCRCRRPRCCCCNNSHRKTRKCVPRTQRLSSSEEAIVASSSFQHGTSANVPRYQKHSCRALCKYLFVYWVCDGEAKKGGAQGGTSAQQEAQLDGSDTCSTAQPQQSHTVAANTHPHKENKTKRKTRRQGVAVCVALRVSARPGRKKTKQEGKKCVLRPTGPRRTPTRHGSLSAPFVAAPPHACSRRGAQGRRHERVGGCASGAVGREHTAPLTGRVQQQAIKEGRVEKKTSTVIASKSKKEKRDGDEKTKNIKTQKDLVKKQN
ncbi:hypothetical protein TCDM_11235 [Trypanosoma cruzi Dm28c]|uniref:Uncharacterized protein n=1 Tax=Trypanosoma cruzi Dm28c TaxID=1416333 RepID=V5AKJ2_TRYCR|nr:hypothetical protein TCDM_11235 [Trypanosoma cruzi Dm28c]